MNHILRTLGTAAVLTIGLAFGLVACNTQNAVTDSARIALGVGFEAYASGYQPVLTLYSKLPYCGDPAQPPCRDRALYKKLYEADAAVAKCSKAAQESLASPTPDFVAITACIQHVEASKLVFVSPLAATASTPVLKGPTE